MYVGYSGAKGVHKRSVMVQGVYIFKNCVFKKSNSMMAWKKKKVRGPDARYARVEKFRVITDAPYCVRS
jgi:hypothetical protein